MKRSVTDIIRRGFDSMVANWPVLLIRIAEGILFMIIVIAAVVAAVVPLLVSLGLNKFEPHSPDDVAGFILSIFFEHWMVLVYLLLIVTVVLLVYVAIHAFVEAGSARVYVDAERATANVAMPARPQLRFFTAERWFEGAKNSWWQVFWIFNIAWGVAGLIILIPMVMVMLLVLMARESPPAMIAIGCAGLIVSSLFTIAVSIVTYIWCQKAIVVSVARRRGASAALSAAWSEFRTDAARHVGVALILFVLMIIGSGVFSSMSMTFGWHRSPTYSLAVLPLQIIGSLANTIFSAAMTSWFLACFAALSVEPRS